MITNLTPHPLTVLDANDNVINTYPKCEAPPRLEQHTQMVDPIEGIPCSSTSFGEGTNIPEKKAGNYFIVSRMVKSAYSERNDFLVPNQIVRDETGRIIGCRSLAIN